ncbi:MAG TPA: hypothetical protein VF517_01400 [Thermoleophilaceae bacterium]|jgi:hypothetical protein
MPRPPALALALMPLALAGCGDGPRSGEPAATDPCRGVGPVTVASDGTGDVSANRAVPKPPPPPAGIDLVQVQVARSATKLCAVFESEAPPPKTGGFRVGLRERGKGDSGTLVGVNAFRREGEWTVELGYPGADERADRGIVDADVEVRGNRVSLVMDTRTLPEATPPASGSEWEASTLGVGDSPNLQYVDCAPESTQHITYPGGELVSFGNGRGSC